MHPLSLIATAGGRLRALFRRDKVEADLSEEIRFHLEMETDNNIRSGMSPVAARRAARIEFGGEERFREEHRDARGSRILEDAIADVRYAARWLLRSPGFALAAILTLGLGIGGTTAVFSVVDGVLLKPLPYAQPDRLVGIWSLNSQLDPEPFTSSPPDFRALRERTTGFDDIAAHYSNSANALVSGEPVRLAALRASSNLFAVLGVRPLIGRAFREEEGVYGNHRVAVLSHAAWMGRFGGSSAIIGSSVAVDAEPYAVIGVMPESFRFPDRRTEIVLPMAFAPDSRTNTRGNYFLFMVGRVRGGTTLERAQSDLERAARQVVADHPESSMKSARLVPLREETVGDSRRALLLMLAATAALMAIACANVAGLLLARAAGRRRELAVRMSVGASRGRLIRQLVTEGLLLSAAGAAVGIALAAASVELFTVFGPADIPRFDEVSIDTRAVMVSIAISLLAAVGFGVWPALTLTGGDQNQALREGARSSTTRQHQRLRRLIVSGQVALALLLLAGSSLFLRSFVAMGNVDPGFRAENVVTASLPLATARYPDARRSWEFADAVLLRLQANPQITTAAITSALSLRGGQWGKMLTLADRTLPVSLDQIPTANYRLVSHDYFRTVGARVTAGRSFGSEDRGDSPGVVVINETMAQKFWPNASPLGTTLWLGPPEEFIASRLPPGFRFPRLTIVGIVADERFEALDATPGSEVYQLYSQSTEFASVLYLAARAKGEPLDLVTSLRAAVREVDNTMPLAEVATMAQLKRESSARRRFGALLISAFALLALTLAVVGIYGVAAQFVMHRRRELAIRMALGAEHGRVVGLVMREGLLTAIIGAVVGLAAALMLSRTMSDLLFGIQPIDPLTFVLTPVVLFLAVAAATMLPARRAAQIPPADVLRSE